MIKQDKFGLIWSYILKVMNFLIFRDFSRGFLNFFDFILGTPLWVQLVVPKASNTTTLKMPKSHVAFRHWLKWLYSVRREKVSENFLSPKSFSIRGQISLSL